MGKLNFDIPLQHVAFLGGFLPRRTNAAPFTTHLSQTFAAEFGCECLGLAVSDIQHRYLYPSRAPAYVRFEISQTNPDSYYAAADFINANDIDLVYLQHDFDIFEGEAGRYIVALAQALKAPLVTTFYTVSADLAPAQKQVITELARFSSRVAAFSPEIAAVLQTVNGVPGEKIDLIDLPRLDGLSAEELYDWPNLAQRFMTCFQRARQAAIQQARARFSEQHIPVTGSLAAGPFEALPVLKLDHFLRMTDETGMLKSSVINLPDYRQGYTTADNASALMFSLLLEQVGDGPFIPIEMQASRHLAFLWNAFNPDRGRFRETMDYSHTWLDQEGTEDTHGLALWALGMALAQSAHPGIQGVARRLFESALPAVQQFSSMLAWGYSLLGIQAYLHRFPGDRLIARTVRLLLDRLIRQYGESAVPDWPWFEEKVAGNSAVLAQALIAASQWADNSRAVEIGLKSLDWLTALQFAEDGMYLPLGDQGYYQHEIPQALSQRPLSQRALSAQRPVEARSMISACLEAYRFTGDTHWLSPARGAFEWFLGRNILGQPLYDSESGGCCDGLLPGKTDPNYSAEALLAFLTAQLEMRLFDQLYRSRTHTSSQLPILQIGLSGPRTSS